MVPVFIIDGYNLIHKMPDLVPLVNDNLERAREVIINLLVRFKARKKIRVVVVFDGKDAGQSAKFSSRGIEILFSRLPEKADNRIVKMIRAAKHPKAWTVVSSDRWIGDQAQTFGAKTIPAEEFARLLKPDNRSEEKIQDEKPEMKPGDLAEWVEYFRKGRIKDG
ncbi:hypothetical protein CH330_01700 [candidate division WOR-3 bacterium JGI_Cruoil_03_51_56]|uniref:RNA-binding protein n=1 Tax=candidate division WOR-3 bacterium JGI_Cruoil_03_51_56 TaxID=1973747 RepID=A0A235BWU9_UNCW3|nr:MAG: hypothetical protein CH330_01700 [candidate division WOR-3 bacterium JGI_Cruoil_03_51_56]